MVTVLRYMARRQHSDAAFVTWQLQNATTVAVFLCISAIKPSGMALMSSRVCGWKALSAPPPQPQVC